MAYNPETRYGIERIQIPVREFHEYADEYVIRPPYQREIVWNTKQRQDLLDSLFRRYYIPNIVLRLIRINESETKHEVIDGQQRINTMQLFFSNKLRLPRTLNDFDTDLGGKYFRDLPSDIRRYIEKELKYNADIVTGIENPRKLEHIKVASDIFWRLQQGESLNAIEKAHARLTSTVRNFLVKYASDYEFDYEQYEEINQNPHKHRFFVETRPTSNVRMQHLTMLGNFLLLETADGPTNLGNAQIANLINETMNNGGLGDLSFEKSDEAKSVLSTLRNFHNLFHDDPLLGSDGRAAGAMTLGDEYFTISIFLLLRHLTKYYAYPDEVRICLREFVYSFYERIVAEDPEDTFVQQFVLNNKLGPAAISERDRIIRHEFFIFASRKNFDLSPKDSKRAFSEAERIAIYIRDKGRCANCVRDGKPDQEALVPWHEFEADHVLPHSQGGQTLIENGQVLCRTHNRQKGATV